jgi:hypothetical protein
MATDTWINTTGGVWEDGSNWSNGNPPGIGDTAKLPAISGAGYYSITENSDVTINALDLLNPNASVADEGVLGLDDGGKNRGTIEVDGGGQLNVGGVLTNARGLIDIFGIDKVLLYGAGSSNTISGGQIGIFGAAAVLCYGSPGTIQNAKITDDVLNPTGDGLQTNSTLNLTNDTITSNGVAFISCGGSGATVNLSGTTITGAEGGQLTGYNGGVFDIVAGPASTLIDCEVWVATTVNVADGSTLALKGTFDEAASDSTLALDSTGDTTTLQIDGTVEFYGNGTITLGDNANNLIAGRPPASSADDLGGGSLDVHSTITGAGTISVAIDIEATDRTGATGMVDATGGNALTLSGRVINGGTLQSDGGGGLVVTGSVNNSGGNVFANTGNVTIDGKLTGGSATIFEGTFTVGSASKVGVTFTDNGGTFALQSSTGFSGTVSGLADNTIDLQDLSFAGLTTEKFKEASGGTSGTLTLGTASQTDRITLFGNYAATFDPPSGQAGFVLSDDGTASHGTLVTYVTATPST